jgi:hypothetical protein
MDAERFFDHGINIHLRIGGARIARKVRRQYHDLAREAALAQLANELHARDPGMLLSVITTSKGSASAANWAKAVSPSSALESS